MKRVLVAVTAIGMLVTVGLISSSNADSGKTTIYACSTARNGNLVKVSYDPVTCPAGTSPISWSTGAQGPKGDTGPKGDKGEQGEPGYSYGEVLASGNDVDSKIWSFDPGASCSPLMSPVTDYWGNTWCIRNLVNVKEISLLSVTFLSGGGNLTLLKESCPAINNRVGSEKYRDVQNSIGLYSGMKPVKYSINTSESCLAVYPTSSQRGQVVIETN